MQDELTLYLVPQPSLLILTSTSIKIMNTYIFYIANFGKINSFTVKHYHKKYKRFVVYLKNSFSVSNRVYVAQVPTASILTFQL